LSCYRQLADATTFHIGGNPPTPLVGNPLINFRFVLKQGSPKEYAPVPYISQ